MAEKRIVWIPVRGNDAEFWARMESVSNESDFWKLLVEAHKNGWVEILGQTDKQTEDLAAVLQEHFKVKVVSDGDFHES
jgi:hypothetical protein